MKATGDVCERCRWQRKRAKRSGSGRNLAKRTASEKISGTATGDVCERCRCYNNTKVEKTHKHWFFAGLSHPTHWCQKRVFRRFYT